MIAAPNDVGGPLLSKNRRNGGSPVRVRAVTASLMRRIFISIEATAEAERMQWIGSDCHAQTRLYGIRSKFLAKRPAPSGATCAGRFPNQQ